MKIIVISDTHGHHEKLNMIPGDVLVHCGDFCSHGRPSDAVFFLDWFSSQPYKYKVFIAGNHDMCFTSDQFVRQVEKYYSNLTYLQDSGVCLEGVNFYGFPWVPVFNNWSFMLNEEERNKKASIIPLNTDVLITHGPPFSILDKNTESQECGCKPLLEHIKEVGPAYHLCGHVHEGRGMNYWSLDKTTVVNASSLDSRYKYLFDPVCINFTERTKDGRRD